MILAGSPQADEHYNSRVWLSFLLVLGGSVHFIDCTVCVRGDRSLFYYLVRVPAVCQRGRPVAHPCGLHSHFQAGSWCGVSSRRRLCGGSYWGRGWIFTVMEGGRGGVFANNPRGDLKFFPSIDSAEMHFSWFARGASAPAAELRCRVRCELPTWKGTPVLRDAFTDRLGPGVSCVLFFPNGCNILAVA